MNVRKEIEMTKPLTDSQYQMLEALKRRSIAPDEDCPALTADQLQQLAELAKQRHEDRNTKK